MDRSDKKAEKQKVALIIVGVVIALIVLGVSVYAIINTTMPRKADTNNQTSTQRAAVTEEDLRLSMEDLNKSLEQEKADRAATQQALDDQVKRIKLSN